MPVKIDALDVSVYELPTERPESDGTLEVARHRLLGPARRRVPIYGSGGFTSYTVVQLEEQLAGWARLGIPRVKMKVGRRPDEDPARVRAARQAIGPAVELFVDANGA